MTENRRQYKRIARQLTMQFSVTDVFPKKWDISAVEDISVGGLKFAANSDVDLSGKTIELQIKVPELAPNIFQIKALVLSCQARLNTKSCNVRAKFIDLSESDKKNLAVLGEIINKYANKLKGHNT